MLDPDADWRQFINPERHLAEKFGVNTSYNFKNENRW